MVQKNVFRELLIPALMTCLSVCAGAASISPPTPHKHHKPSGQPAVHKTTAAPHAQAGRYVAKRLVPASVRGPRRHHHYYGERFYTNSYAEGQTEGDVFGGEDSIVRQAAIDALGNMNGTVVAINPDNGRILAMVNQKMALSAGAEPCSTIKVPVALAALSENLVTKDTLVPLTRTYSMNLTEALAHSNNAYFEALGRKLGFDKYSYYARQFGLGELAGWQITGEHLGVFPSEPLDEEEGGVGRMCSFGQGISMTPLQLGAIMSAVANGGTLYYLQHPQTAAEAAAFVPKVKRHLDIAPLVPQMMDGMAGAVEYGTARALHVEFSQEPVLGKTGTCSNSGTRYGWFASYANTDSGRLVVVVFLEGGRPVYGGRAADVAGVVYRELYDHSFFGAKSTTPIAGVVTRTSLRLTDE